MKRLLCFVAVSMLALPALAAAKTWHVNSSAGTLGFDGAYQGQAFHGVFQHFNADIRYDPAHLDTAHFDVTVPLQSVDTQSRQRDQTLTGSQFFDVSQHPSAHFVTQSFSRDATGQVIAHGTLTLDNVTQPVTLKVQFQDKGDHATLDVQTHVNRLDFKLGTDSGWDKLRKRVDVHAHLRLPDAAQS